MLMLNMVWAGQAALARLALLADKGHHGDRFRERLLIRAMLPIIPRR
jgi:hypothetical protein